MAAENQIIYARVARGRKPFAQEWSGGAAADAALLGAPPAAAPRGGVGIMTVSYTHLTLPTKRIV